MERLIPLREALALVETSPHDAALFLPGGGDWAVDSPCAILAVDPYDDGEVDPPFARRHGLRHALSVAQVQDVVANARDQIAEPTPEQLLTAFLFYYDRDAFIDFGEGRGSRVADPGCPTRSEGDPARSTSAGDETSRRS